MIELNVLDALMTAGHALMLASLIYQRSLQEVRPTVCRGEPEHGSPGNALDQIAANTVRMARAAR
jgi:hypothetical protein